jgi:hypothetical protein
MTAPEPPLLKRLRERALTQGVNERTRTDGAVRRLGYLPDAQPAAAAPAQPALEVVKIAAGDADTLIPGGAQAARSLLGDG